MIKMNITVDLGKIKDLKRMMQKYPMELERALEEGILSIALSMEAFAKQKIKEQGAIDLGQLLNSITVKRISPKHALVGTNIEYAAAVEFGTKGHWLKIDNIPGFRNWMKHHGIDPEEKMEFFYVEPKPRPYMEPAFQWGKQIMPDEVNNQIEKTMRRLKNEL
jgi:phage gpG-like protein